MIVRWTDPRYQVLLDGKELDSYHEADDEEGYVVITKTIQHGGATIPQVDSKTGRLKTERLTGEVKIIRRAV